LKRSFWTGVSYLAFTFGLALAVDLPIALALFLLEKLAEVVMHRHIEYG
ncbi:MAG: hypothetical protein H5T63_01010, partial [Chloroflexi bacterium]|nr:hypothetical protein [Chloroflexota bacterium]